MKLEHEGIARLYDGGLQHTRTHDQIPYLVMEPYAAAADYHHAKDYALSWLERLAVFVRHGASMRMSTGSCTAT